MLNYVIVWAPELQMLFGLLTLLWYGTHYSSIIFEEKSSKRKLLPLSSNMNNENLNVVNKHSALTGPLLLSEHCIYWGGIWALLSAIVAYEAPFQTLQFSGVFLRDSWSSSLSFFLFSFGACCLWVSAKWSIWAKNVHMEYGILIALSLFGQHFLLMSTDLMSLYVCLELQSFCFVILCSINYYSLYSIEAGMKYFLLSAFSSGLMLFGISLIYWTTGITNLQNLSELLQCSSCSHSVIFLLGVWLVSTTLLWKLAAAPLHMWAADVYGGAPSSVSLGLSTLPKLAILGFWIHQWHPIWVNTFGNLMLWFSGFSMIVGAIGAMSQVQIKRLLAFSSIGHMGILLMPLCYSQGSISVLLVHLFLYFCTSLLTWGSLMRPFYRGSSNEPSTPQYLWDFSLLWKTQPVSAWVWAIAMMSLAGLPPIAGFLGKLGIFWWSLNVGQYLLLFTALASTLISAVYYLRLLRIMYMDTPQEWSTFNSMNSLSAYLLAIPSIFLCISLWYSSPLLLATHIISLY